MIGARLQFSEEAVESVSKQGAGPVALAAREAPLLAELWDNKVDAEYDNL